MVANYTLQWLDQESIPLIWRKVDWNCRLLFYFVKLFLQMKEKTMEEVQNYEKQKKEVEQEKEKLKKKKLKKEK